MAGLKGYEKTSQSSLADFIDDEEGNVDVAWKKEWKNMPEFVQDSVEPFSKIVVRFESLEDLNEFSKLIGQVVTPQTKSIWHPKMTKGLNIHKRYK